jgi:hypothetical protein
MCPLLGVDRSPTPLNPMRILFAALFSICPLIAALPGGCAAEPAFQLTSPQCGPARIADETSPYFYFRARIESKAGGTVAFKSDTCRLLGVDGQVATDCWISITGASAGLSESKNAPIAMRTYAVASADGAKPAAEPVEYNTDKVDGPAGSIEIVIPKNGFVELYFLWSVPNGFQPRRVVLKGIAESALPGAATGR